MLCFKFNFNTEPLFYTGPIFGGNVKVLIAEFLGLITQPRRQPCGAFISSTTSYA